MHRQSIPQLVPHIPSLAYRPFFWLWCLLKSNFHPGRVPVAPSCAHTGLPRVLGAVRALMAVTCILQVRWVRLREVNGADLGNTTPTALEWPLMMGQAPRLMPLCIFSCRPHDSIMKVWCCYCPRVTEKIEAQRTVAQTGQSRRA